MPTYHLVAMNPNVAVMTGTAVKTADMVKVVSIVADDPKAAFAAGAERADSMGYRALAIGVPGELLVAAEIGKRVEPIEVAFPTDPVLAGNNAFHVDEQASFRLGDQPGDFMANRADWDKPIQAIVFGGEEIGLERIEKSWGGAGFGFQRGSAISETYLAGEGEDAVVIRVRRDKRTVAASARLKSFQATPSDEKTWFHSLGGEQATIASAVMAAVRHARGFDPTHGPDGGSLKP